MLTTVIGRNLKTNMGDRVTNRHFGTFVSLLFWLKHHFYFKDYKLKDYYCFHVFLIWFCFNLFCFFIGSSIIIILSFIYTLTLFKKKIIGKITLSNVSKNDVNTTNILTKSTIFAYIILKMKLIYDITLIEIIQQTANTYFPHCKWWRFAYIFGEAFQNSNFIALQQKSNWFPLQS